MRKMNKKGAEFTISTLIVIVLAIIVLVVLALGFGTGWSNMWSRMSGLFSPVNVDSIKLACDNACQTQATYAYCSQLRDLTIQGADGKKEPLKGQTCDGLATTKSSLGFEKCGGIDCGGSAQPKIYDTQEQARIVCEDDITLASGASARLSACNSVKQVKQADSTLSQVVCKNIITSQSLIDECK